MREVTDERSTRPPVYIGDFEHRESVQSDGSVTRDYVPPGIESTPGRSTDGLSRSDPELRDHLPYVSVRRRTGRSYCPTRPATPLDVGVTGALMDQCQQAPVTGMSLDRLRQGR